ncbi:MAG TPA: hypothetical protein VK203_00180 [Nostocaceae cyanobacterium]|nr:hypothetical protein [Nostocaceae cyanobacterium]
MFLAFAQPSSDCIWFSVGVYGSFGIALICAWGYTYKFIQNSQTHFLQFIHLTIAKIIFFCIWGLATITSIRLAMQSVCPNTLFSAHTSGTQFNQYGDISLFLLLLLIAFGLSLLINILFGLVELFNR